MLTSGLDYTNDNNHYSNAHYSMQF